MVALSVAGLVLGWRLFQFICDDAYIFFRYARNLLSGVGPTWNPPPMAPVEGYTSFLWLVVISAVWKVTGIAPPQFVDFLTLGFSIGSILLLVAALRRIVNIDEVGGSRRMFLIALALLLLVTNRTFLMWSSSGLETALFNFLLHLWLYLAWTSPNATPARVAGLSLVSALLVLARPDGLLYLGAFLVMLPFFSRTVSQGRRVLLAGLAGPAVVAAHLSWRISYYGELLPNTYTAKVNSPWPAAGLHYFAAFVLEYGLWLWGIVVIWAVFRWVRKSGLPVRRAGAWFRLLTVLAVLGHLAYYTLLVGGDHFEYRVYSFLVPVVAFLFVWALKTLSPRLVGSVLIAALFALSATWIPWVEFIRARKYETVQEFQTAAPTMAEVTPGPAGWYSRAYDTLQAYLRSHAIGLRHQEHRTYAQQLLTVLPFAEGDNPFAGVDNPVVISGNVGVLGWLLPDVILLDLGGLNDRIIARTPVPKERERLMAHEHVPPTGYVERFLPMMMMYSHGEVIVRRRSMPLTDETIRLIEAEFWELALQGKLVPDPDPLGGVLPSSAHELLPRQE